jgi:phage terminase small subunit
MPNEQGNIEKEPKLNERQQLFVAHYLECWSATEAAKRAGYSERSAHAQGSRLLKDADISAAIAGGIAEIMPAGEVLMRLAQHARGSMADFLDLTSDEPRISIDKDAPLHLIKRIKTKRYTAQGATSDEVEIELYDAQAALIALGKYHKLFSEQRQIDDGDDQPIVHSIVVVTDADASSPAHSIAEKSFSMTPGATE